MPFGDIGFSGYWNASTNRVFGSANEPLREHVQGSIKLYKVLVAGDTKLNDVLNWEVGDFAYYNGFEWCKISGGGQSARVEGLTLRALGYIGDGQKHPLSQRFSSLAAARQFYPRANSLTEQIDGHAIQRLIDLNPGGVRVDIPAGTGFSSFPLKTEGAQGVAYKGAGRGITKLVFVTPGGDGIQHGLNVIASARFELTDLTLECEGVGGTAINVEFNPSNVDIWCHKLESVMIQGNGNQILNYWTRATCTKNMPRGLTWKDVINYGKAFSILPSNAHDFIGTHACFSYYFENCCTIGYRWGWEFFFVSRINGNCHEGVTMYNCQSYSGYGMLRAFNRLGTYVTPEWIIISPGYQGTGIGFDMTQIGASSISGSPLLVTDAGTTPGRCLCSIVDCQDFSITDLAMATPPVGDMSIGLEAGVVSGVTGIFVGGAGTQNITIDRTAVVAFQPWDQIVYIAPEVLSNQVRERDTYNHPGTTNPLNGVVVDASGKQNCSTPLEVINNVSPTKVSVDENGVYEVSGRAAVMSNGAGRASVPLPLRPSTNTTFFPGGEPTVTLSLRNAALADGAPPPTVARTAMTGINTGFDVLLSAPNASFEIEYIARGK